MSQISPASSEDLLDHLTTKLCHCGKLAKAKGLCHNHYTQKWKRSKGLIKGPKPTILCHCGERQVAKGLCSRHYSEQLRFKEPDRQKEYHRKYVASQKGSARRSRRRAAIYQAQGSHTAEDILRLKEAQKHCLGCGDKFSEDKPSTVDHKIPLIRGGSNSVENLQLLCGPCNSSKGSKTNDEWLSNKSSKLSRLTERGGEDKVVEFPNRQGKGGA